MLTGFHGRDPFTATAKFTTLFRIKMTNDKFASVCVGGGWVGGGGGERGGGVRNEEETRAIRIHGT